MRPVLVFLPFLLLSHSLFQGLAPFKLLIFLSLSLGFALLPQAFFSPMRYLLVSSSLFFSFFFLLRGENLPDLLSPFVLFSSSYAVLLYLSKGGLASTRKELIGLSLISFSLFLNFHYSKNHISSVAFFLTLAALLFLSGRSKLIPLSSIFLFLSSLALFKRGDATRLTDLEAFAVSMILLSSSIILLLALLQFLRNEAQSKRLAFFGSLFICISVILTVLFRLPSEILFRDSSFLAFSAPLCGLMMKKGEER